MIYKVGTRVEEKYLKIKGTVVVSQEGHMVIEWDNGTTDMVHINYSKHIQEI